MASIDFLAAGNNGGSIQFNARPDGGIGCRNYESSSTGNVGIGDINPSPSFRFRPTLVQIP